MTDETGFTPEQNEKYQRDGWVVLPSLFTGEECDGLRRHMDAVHAGKVAVQGFEPPAAGADHLVDMDQCHIHDPVCRDFMLHPKLRAPLTDALDGEAPEGIKSHYWWKGSQWSQGWHCDGTALPGCIGVWMPLVDVDEEIGTLALQSGGHRRRILHHDDLRHGKWAGRRTHSGDPELGARLKKEIFEENAAAGCAEVHIVASRGAAVIFDGYLWHRGLMGRDPSAFRQVYACHYVSAAFAEWPHVLWERIDFDGVRRWSTGHEPTPAARHNARLPRHPAMEAGLSNEHPSLLPTRKDAPLQILRPAQADDLDVRGFTVIESAFSTAEIASLRDEVERHETAAQGPGGGLAHSSRVARSLCASAPLQRACHDVLNCDDVRLLGERVESRLPAAARNGRQDSGFRQEIDATFVEPLQFLTCWIPLDEATGESGCLWFVPDLFRRGALLHETDPFDGSRRITGLRADDAVRAPAPVGSVVLFWSLTPYAIGADHTDRLHRAYVCQFAPDGFHRVWENDADGGRGGPLRTEGAAPADDTIHFQVLRGRQGVPAPPLPAP